MFDNFFHKNNAQPTAITKEAVAKELKEYTIADSEITPNNIYVNTALSISNNAFDYNDMYKYMVYAESKGIPFHIFLYNIIKKVENEETLVDAICARLQTVNKARNNTIEKMVEQSVHSRPTLEKSIKELDCVPNYFYSMGWHKLNKKELNELVKDTQKSKKHALKRVQKISGMTSEQLAEHMRHCYEVFGIDEDSYFAYAAWEATDDVLGQYLTNGMSKCIRAYYNDSRGNAMLSDKGVFSRRFAKLVNRKCWESASKAYDSFCQFIEGQSRIIIKPIKLMAGLGIRFVDIDSNTDIRELYDSLVSGPDVIAEEVIRQHKKMSEMYAGSVNTVRIVTLQKGEDVHIITGFVRFGVDGNVDNYGAGGLTCRIDVETGEITTRAVRKSGEYFEKHPVSGITFKGFKIPLWDEVIKTAKAAISKYKSINYAGWDIAICEDKVVIVEGNSWPGVDTGRHDDPEFPGRRYLFNGLTPF